MREAELIRLRWQVSKPLFLTFAVSLRRLAVMSFRSIYSSHDLLIVHSGGTPFVCAILNLSGDTRRTQLLVGVSRYRWPHRLCKLQMSFGVEEILDPLDFQASILVGDDVHN